MKKLNFFTYYDEIECHFKTIIPEFNEDTWDIDELPQDPQKKRNNLQANKCRLLWGCILHRFQPEDYYDTSKKMRTKLIPLDDSSICKVLSGRKKSFNFTLGKLAIRPEVVHESGKYFSKFVLNYIAELDVLVGKIKALIPASDMEENMKEQLLSYVEGAFQNTSEFLAMSFLESIRISCEYPVELQKKGEEYALIENLVTTTYDPFADFRKRFTDSRALVITVTSNDLHNFKMMTKFHHFEYFRDYLLDMKQTFRIISVERNVENPGWLDVRVKESPYRLIRLHSNEHFEKAREFVRKHLGEFRQKVTWKGRSLSEMMYSGLQSQIWVGYAYFDQQDNIVSYIDFKIRTDTDIEIGIVLTDASQPEVVRGKGLATSLILFLRIIYSMHQFYAGTFEENDAMRYLFEKTGFKTNHILKPDRGRPEDIDYPDRLTNSLYYYADPLMREKDKQ